MSMCPADRTRQLHCVRDNREDDNGQRKADDQEPGGSFPSRSPSSRCTGSTWAFPPAAARRTAWERASWLLVVSFALSIVVFLCHLARNVVVGSGQRGTCSSRARRRGAG